MKYLYYYLFFIIVILFFAFINSRPSEAFTPFLRTIYRPYVRNARIYSQKLYNKHSANATNLFRKVGII